MREPANKRLITDVSGLAPTVARSSQKQLLTRFWRGSLVACPRVDNGHKSIADWPASSQGLAAVRHFGPAIDRSGSKASDRRAGRLRGMSAVPQIATELWLAAVRRLVPEPDVSRC